MWALGREIKKTKRREIQRWPARAITILEYNPVGTAVAMHNQCTSLASPFSSNFPRTNCPDISQEIFLLLGRLYHRTPGLNRSGNDPGASYNPKASSSSYPWGKYNFIFSTVLPHYAPRKHLVCVNDGLIDSTLRLPWPVVFPLKLLFHLHITSSCISPQLLYSIHYGFLSSD